MASLTPRLDRLEQNLVINGGMDFWQRGTSVTGLVSTSSTHLADRFLLRLVGTTATYRMDRSTDIPIYAQSGYQGSYSLAVQPTVADASVAAGDNVSIEYRMEGYDYTRIASGKSFTVSFWAKSVLAGTYCLSFSNAAGDRCHIKEYTLAANTWTKVTVSLNTDTSGVWLLDNGRGIAIRWSLMSGTTTQSTANTWQAGGFYATSNQVNLSSSTSNIFYITQVMLIPGDFSGTDVEIPFQRCGRTIQDELAMCQRYYEKSYNVDVAPGTASANANRVRTNGSASNSSVDGSGGIFAVEKRAVPSTIGFWNFSTGTASQWSVNDQTTGATATVSASEIGTKGFAAALSVAGLVLGRSVIVSGHWAADAEI